CRVTEETKKELFNKFKDKQIRVSIKPLFIVAESYQEKLVMNPATEFSNILNISLEDANQEKAKDILNNLIFTYNNNAIIDKKAIADKTSTFIDERIKEISTNLTSVDQTAQDFKTTKGVTDIQGEANIALNIGAANRQELENAKTQLNIASGMKDYVSSETGYEVLPSNVGLSDPTIANTT
ncbi:MAG TPA: tyrosine protein kinase, partial [Maribacter sp.]|nr:tyrosine protein kinase [Maribacter sp.]